MLKATINISATTEEEIMFAFEEVRKKLNESYTSGSDSREDGITKYNFKVTGKASKFVECKCGYRNYYEGSNNKPLLCWDCEKGL